MSKKDINKIVRLEGLDVDRKWEDGYEWGAFVERTFPGQECWDLCQCINYNIDELMFANFADVTCLQVGQGDESNWHWKVTLASGRIIVIVGGCDYTGWDCQSWGNYKEVVL
jgi:hypothetical protein